MKGADLPGSSQNGTLSNMMFSICPTACEEKRWYMLPVCRGKRPEICPEPPAAMMGPCTAQFQHACMHSEQCCPKRGSPHQGQSYKSNAKDPVGLQA